MHIIVFKTGTGRSGFTTEAGHEGRPGEVGGSQPSGRYSGEEYERRRAAAREAVRRSRERWRARQQIVPEGRKYNIAEIFASIPDVITNVKIVPGQMGDRDNRVEFPLDQAFAEIKSQYPMVDENMLKRFLYVEGLNATVKFNKGMYSNGLQMEIEWKKDLLPGQNPAWQSAMIYQKIQFLDYKTVDFEYLNVDNTYKDKDIGMPLVIKQVAMLKLLGAKRGEIYADISIGKYSWAKEGVEYRDRWNAENAQRQYNDYKLHMRSKYNIDIPVDNSYMSFTHPYQWAQYKLPGVSIPHTQIKNSDVNPGNYNIGKAFMLDENGHGSWHAVIDFEKLTF